MALPARVWDLTDDVAARAFLGADASHAGRLPLPCRAAIVPTPSGSGTLELRGVPEGVVIIALAGRIVVAGPERALSRIPDDSAPLRAVRQALQRYAVPPHPIRFSDGTLLDVTSRARIMGVLNVTPDSFSDGGRFVDPAVAAERVAAMVQSGADLIDIGAESTRPGAAPVGVTEEWRRLAPVIARLARDLPDLRVSIDTRHAETAERALDAGAALVNDVSALGDDRMAKVVARHECPIVLMHMRGAPRDMQHDTKYRDLVGEVLLFLADRAESAESAGIHSDRIVIDPGFGFGKSPDGNEDLLHQLGSFRSLGHPILIGVSRKAFIGRRTGVALPQNRLAGSLAAAVAAVLSGARIVRTHDVAATREALATIEPLWARSGFGPTQRDLEGGRQ